ncbi:MAG TPA: hypothetical protein VHY84_08055 [Bryobacteraceae bacterium]|jgi:type I restriction enzyme M protein|nr:hypothetical protein [Bryobacteraceae bacterium]
MDQATHTRYFYLLKPLRTLEKIRADILALQKEAEGLLDEPIRQDEPAHGASA